MSRVSEEQQLQIVLQTLGKHAGQIGDDCAVLPWSGSHHLLLTTDMLVEKVDFDLSYCSLADVGYKSVMVNVSDVAAMGGKPLWALISVGQPGRGDTRKAIKDLYAGIKRAASRVRVKIVGGDFSRAGAWTVNVAVVGQVPKGNVKPRSGAKPGNVVFVVGNLGWSAAGLSLLSKGKSHSGKREFRRFVRAHLRPEALFREGCILGRTKGVTSLMDVSDGLSTDLHRLCRASRCGAVLNAESLPVSPVLARAAKVRSGNPLHWILNGGEDFALLGTCAMGVWKGLKRKISATNAPLCEIGIVQSKRQVEIVSQSIRKPLSSGGFDHFLL